MSGMAGLAVQVDALLRDIPAMVDSLCKFATFANATGDRWGRDVSIEVAAYLIGENGGVCCSDDAT
jgi:hypothetical protein